MPTVWWSEREEAMGNIFFYAGRDSASFRQVEAYFQLNVPGAGVRTIPPGTRFSSAPSLDLRSNYILILFAEDDADIEHFITLRREYESFRIILIINNGHHITNNRFTLLSPRYIAHRENDLDGVIQYLANIVRQSTL
jgi:hypothetical protein